MKRRLLLTLLALCMVLALLPMPASAAAGYTNEELCSMARQHFKDHHRQEPPIVQVDQEHGNEVVIHLYEIISNHHATFDWYYINRSTGKGTNFMGETIDLTPYAPNKPSGGFPFQDVSRNDWFYDSVSYVYQNGLFSGTSATTFSPNSSMDRAMLVTVLYRLEGQPSVSGYSRFQDTDSRAYYDKAVTWASARGIVTGTGGNGLLTYGSNLNRLSTFSPHNPITHEQLEVILYRYAVLYCGIDSSITADLSSYKDGSQVSDYAKKAVSWCVSKSIVTGDTLTPKSNATRAEVAAMLYRLSNLTQSGSVGYRQTLETLIKDFGANYESSSMYYDITDDGVEELFCIYWQGEGKWPSNGRAAIYTISGGNPVRLMDEYACSPASVPFAALSVVTKSGKTYICLQEENSGYTDPGTTNWHGTYKIYLASNENLPLVQEVQYEIRESPDSLRSDVVMIENGQKKNMTYNEYQSWLNSWTCVASIFSC